MDDLRVAWGRAPRARPARREVAWELLRGLLGDAGHPGASLSNPCPRCGGAHGPVRIADGVPWRASVTYAAGYAIAAISPQGPADAPEKPSPTRETRADPISRVDCGFSRPRGFAIDAEAFVDPVRDAAGGAPGGLLHWVRTEAVLKADGRGLRADRDDVEFGPDGPDGPRGPHGWTARIVDTGVHYRGFEPNGHEAPPGVLLSAAWEFPAAAGAPGHPATR